MFEKDILKIYYWFEGPEEMVLFQEHYRKNFLTTDDGMVPFDFNELLKDDYSLITDLQVGRKNKIQRITYRIKSMEKSA